MRGPPEEHSAGETSASDASARDTMRRALVLLTDPAAPGEGREEGFACVRAAIDAQILDDLPDDPRGNRGTWFWRGAGDTGHRADLNFADFIGTDILQLLRHDAAPGHADWPPGLHGDLAACLRRAVDCSIRRRVRVSYTNPLAMSIEMCALTGELLGVPEYVEAARERLDEWIAFTDRAGGFEEFNSNTYGGVTLPHTATLVEHVRDGDIREKALYMERKYFDHVLDFYHAPTGETCMPRSRAYSERFAGRHLHEYLCRAVAMRRPGVKCGPEWEAKPSHLPVFSHATEEQFDRLLAPLEQAREIRHSVEWIGQDHVGLLDQVPTVGGDGTRRREIAAYLHPEFCIGSVNEIDSWTQRRALGGYVRTAHGSAMVSWRPETEVAGCEADELTQLWPVRMYFNLCTGQVGSTVLAGVSTMPVDDEWLCGSHWRQKVRGVVEGVTVDFGFDIEGAACDEVPQVGVPWQVRLGDCTLTLLFIGATAPTPSVHKTENGMRVTLLRRENFAVDWADPPRLGLAFLVNIAPRGESPQLGEASWRIQRTELECSARVGERRLHLRYDPPGIEKLTSRALWFTDDGE